MFEASNRTARKLVLFVGLVAITAFVAHASGVTREAATRAPTLTQAPAPVSPSVEVVFVIDTTGSMSGLIEGAKQKIWSIANQLASGQPRPKIRIGLVAYRDRGDAYVTKRFDLTDDIDAVYAELYAFSADGGGDTPESVNQALHEAVSQLSWSEGSDVYRVVFLVGDAPPHMNYANDVSYRDSVRLAVAKGIIINTVQCGSLASTTPVWKQIALAGEGDYLAIAQDGAMVAITTPLDDALAQLNRELADTALAYGAEEEKAELLAKLKRSLDAPAAVAASRLSYFSKAGGRLNAGRRDLVAAVKGGLEIESVAKDELPAQMREMEPAAQEAYVQERVAQRAVIQAQIVDLSAKRDAYVRAETDRLAASGAGDGFDAKVLGAIREQAAAKGIAYE